MPNVKLAPLRLPQREMKAGEEKSKRSRRNRRTESEREKHHAHGRFHRQIPSQPAPRLACDLPLNMLFARKPRHSTLLFQKQQMTVQRIHQQPLIAQWPSPQNWTAFIHETSERNAFGMFFESSPNQVRSAVDKTARLRKELRYLRTVECWPVSGINPVNIKCVQHL